MDPKIKEAKDAGIPSLAFKEAIDNAVMDVVMAMGSENREKARAERDKIVRRAMLLQRLRIPVALFGLLVGVAALIAHVWALQYGWNELAAPSLGVATLTFWQVFAVAMVIRYGIKGMQSRRAMDQQEAERLADKNRLWFDKWKRAFETNFINALGAGLIYGLFWLLSGVI